MQFTQSTLLGLAVLFAAVLGGDVDQLTTCQVKVMTFNLRTTFANDKCPSGCWEQRKWRAKKLVEKYQPDLIGTQEGAPDQIEFFQTNSAYKSVGECAGECSSNERDSIFYNPDRWEVLENTTFVLSDTPEVLGSNTWNLQYLRAAVMARFQSKSGGGVVCMLNTHFDIDRGHDKSAVLIAERFNKFCRVSDLTAVTGDFNALPETSAMQYLGNEASIGGSPSPILMYDSLTAAGQGGPTWIGSSFANKPTRSKFDYIFTRHDSTTCLQNASILVDTFDGYSSSDHAVPMSTFCVGFQCSDCLSTSGKSFDFQSQL